VKSLAIYSSQSGDTKKLADAVCESLKGEGEIYPIADAPELINYDSFAVGFWLKAVKPDPETLEYLPKIGNNKKVFLFAAHGTTPGSDHAQAAMIYAIELIPAAEIVGRYNCRGEVNPKIIERIYAKPELPAWIKG
jgi:flavodoxin I